jgi:hypothetical protein
MDKPFQRKVALNNAHVGRDFETMAQQFFAKQGLHLIPGVLVQIGINGLDTADYRKGSVCAPDHGRRARPPYSSACPV